MDVDQLLERSLRQGPPDDARFHPAMLHLPFEDEAGVAPVRDLLRVGYRSRGGNERAVTGANVSFRAAVLSLAVIVAAVAGFAVGRGTANPGAAATPAPTPLIAPAIVPDGPSNAFDQANSGSGPLLWVVCPAGPHPECAQVPPTTLDPGLAATYNPPRRGWASASTFWARVQSGDVKSGHLVAVAVAQPQRGVDAQLFSLADPSGSPTGLTSVNSDPQLWFVDLGTLAPGRYVLVLLTDETTPTPGLTGIGFVVTGPPASGQ